MSFVTPFVNHECIECRTTGLASLHVTVVTGHKYIAPRRLWQKMIGNGHGAMPSMSFKEKGRRT